MKKKIVLLILSFCFFSLGLKAQCSDGDFEEQNNIVVIEMESGTLPSGWNEETGTSGFTGSSFIAWRGSDFFNTPGNGVITYSIYINTPGEYRFQWRSKVGIGSNSTEHNDSWLRIDDADSFFGRKDDGSLVFPRGRDGNPKPEGASSDGWLKAYLNGTTNWTWSTLTSDNDGHEIYATFNNPGQYTIEVSGRSNGHFIDRMVLYRESEVSESQATMLSREETTCPSGPDCSNLMLSLDPDPTTTCGGNDGAITSNVTGAQGSVSYDWSNGATTPNISGLDSGDYTLTITDAAGCTASMSATVAEPAPPTVSLTPFADVVESDAAFALTGGSPAGGTYSGTGVSGNSFDPSVGQGTYTITYTYTDPATQCSASASQDITVTMTDCSNLTLSLGPDPTTTCGGNDGAITSNVTGAQGNVSYDWSNGATTPNISGLDPGDYTLTITDAAGCTASMSASVAEPAPPTVSLTPFADVAESDAAFALTGGSPAGGTYSGTGVSGNSFDPSVGQGTYTITYTYTDPTTQCSASASQDITVTMTDCSNLMLSLDPDPTTTCGGNDGAITANVTGAQGSVSYDWSNGATTQNISGLAPGDYTLTITDAAGCTASMSASVAEPAPPTVSLTPFADVAESDAAFALTGGSPAGGTYSGTGVSGNSFDPSVGQGTYTITYTYTDPTTQCSASASQDITVTMTDCSNLMLSLDPAPTTTCGGNDGAITANVSGAQGSVSYDWSNGATTQNISGLDPGDYTLTITDAAGCTASMSATVAEPAPPTVSLTPFADVAESDAAFALTGGSPAGGTYSGTGVSGNSFDPSVGQGTYTITYTYTDPTTQCSASASQDITVTMTDCSNLMLSLDPDPTTTCGGNDGAITANVTGAQGSVSYDWSNGATTQNISGLDPGDYTLTITDAAGCTASMSATVAEPAPPTVSLTPFADVAESDAAFALTGGSPAGGTYSETGVSGNSFDPSVGQGTYTITYTYTDPTTQCSASASQDIIVIEGLPNDDTVFIFPNPIEDGRYRVKIPEDATGPMQYGIFDATGKAIKIGTLDSNGSFINFDVSNLVLQRGIYRLVIEGVSLEKPITISFLNN